MGYPFAPVIESENETTPRSAQDTLQMFDFSVDEHYLDGPVGPPLRPCFPARHKVPAPFEWFEFWAYSIFRQTAYLLFLTSLRPNVCRPNIGVETRLH